MATTGRTLHVIPRDDGWAVRGEGDTQDTLVTTTRREAVLRAQEIAQQDGAEVVVHTRDGTLLDENASIDGSQALLENRHTERIAIDPEIVHGKPRIAGTRIMVYQILDLLAAGKSFEEIISEDYFPDLTIEDVIAAVDYAARVMQSDAPRLS